MDWDQRKIEMTQLTGDLITRYYFSQSRPFVTGESSLSGLAIEFPKTNRHHSGIYNCFADNGWGSPASAKVGG